MKPGADSPVREQTVGRRVALVVYGVMLILALFPTLGWMVIAVMATASGDNGLLIWHAQLATLAPVTLVGCAIVAFVFAALPRDRPYQIYVVTMVPLAHFVVIVATLVLAFACQ